MKVCLFMLLTGVVAGILLAPEKGSVTRKKIVDGFRDLQDGINREIDDLTDKIVTAAERIDESAQRSA